MAEHPNLASATEAAYYNRRVAGKSVPIDAELDALADRVERWNSRGSYQDFVDAQSDLIDALLVRVHVLSAAPPTTTPESETPA